MASKLVIEEKPLFSRRRLRMVAVGAGFMNLMLAYKHKYESKSDFIDLRIYEKNAGIGGTWWENRYPGAACDVPAHIYCFPFAPNPDYTQFYATGPEILKYIQTTAARFGLNDYVQLNSKLVEAVWDEDRGKWILKIDHDGKVIDDEADILVNGTGVLNHWEWPRIPGLHDFQGSIVHTADWKAELDWDGKRVGIIGNGSSGVQVLPQLQKTAKSIVSYVRGAGWVTPGMLAEFTPEGENFQYPEAQKEEWRQDEATFLAYRKKLDAALNGYFALFLKSSPQQAAARPFFDQHMRQALKKRPGLAKDLVPDFAVGCRRLTPGPGYLEALQAENVKIRFDKIVKVTEKGILTRSQGDSHSLEQQLDELDIIVCATGFEMSYIPRWTMIGRNGVTLQSLWKDNPYAYMGIAAPSMPNYFMFTGPNAPYQHGTLMPAMESCADYMFRWAQKISEQGIHSVCINDEVLKEYNEYTQQLLKRTVWTENCRSWFKKDHEPEAPVQAMYGGSGIHYRQMLEAFRTDDFDILYKGHHEKANRFAFMGNGLTQVEIEGGDLSYYMTRPLHIEHWR